MAENTNENNEAPCLLAVLAHPDDETFGMGGTLAYYARRGVQTYLVCATRGEAGEIDPHYLDGFASIAERREHELECAAEKLGLSGVFFLDYRDSGMQGSKDNAHPRALAGQPVEQVAAEIAEFIRRLRSQVLVTFDPIGGYRHPDHIAIHQATVIAFDLAADASFRDDSNLAPFSAVKFYYQTVPHGFLRLIVRIMQLLGRELEGRGRGAFNLTCPLRSQPVADTGTSESP